MMDAEKRVNSFLSQRRTDCSFPSLLTHLHMCGATHGPRFVKKMNHLHGLVRLQLLHPATDQSSGIFRPCHNCTRPTRLYKHYCHILSWNWKQSMTFSPFTGRIVSVLYKSWAKARIPTQWTIMYSVICKQARTGRERQMAGDYPHFF